VKPALCHGPVQGFFSGYSNNRVKTPFVAVSSVLRFEQGGQSITMAPHLPKRDMPIQNQQTISRGAETKSPRSTQPKPTSNKSSNGASARPAPPSTEGVAKPAATPAQAASRPSAPPAQTASRPSQKPVDFVFNSTQAKSVCVAASFNDWDVKRTPMRREQDGNWKATVLLPPGKYEYRFVVDGEWMSDPNCKECVENQFGSTNSTIAVA
jgi:hypothetical protein